MTFSTIVVGVDGGPGGVDAIALARRLAVPASEIIAVAVAAVDAQPSPKANPHFDRAAREEAHERLTDLRAQQPELRTEVVRSRYVADGLRAAAQRFDADLLVVGSCRRGLVGRFFLGDDAAETLRFAPCPVAVATRDYALRDVPIASIGLGWAEQAESDCALDLAERLSEDIGARLHALTVVDVSYGPVTEGTTAAAELSNETQRLLAAFAELSDIELSTATGAPVEELLAFAAEVDLLIVGSHQRAPLKRIVLGSTSEALTRRSVHPLLVVSRLVEHGVATSGR